MAKYSEKHNPFPDKKDSVKMKEFFKMKYTERRFEKNDSDDEDDDSSSEDEKKKKKRKDKKHAKAEEATTK